MPVLVNAESGLAEDLPQESADQALASGSHHIPLNDPEGNPVTVPVGQAHDLLAAGYSQPHPEQLQSLIDHAKYSSTGEQIKAGLEGAAQGATFGLSTGLETAVGVKPEDIRGREEANPGTHEVGQLAGLAASALIPGLGEANVLHAAGEGAAAAVGLGGAEAGFLSQVGAEAVKGAFEMGLMQGGQEIHRAFAEDPDQSAETAITDIGLAGVLGGVFGAGVGAIKEGIGGIRGKFISQVDRPAVEAGDFEATIKHSDLVSDSERKGILDGLREQKADAPAIRAAGERLGAPVMEGMTSASPLVQKAEDSLINGAPTVSGIRRQAMYAEGYQKASQATQTALEADSNYTKAELGNVFKSSLTDQLKQEVEPIEGLYNELKQYHEAIPLSEKSAPAIIRNLGKLPEFRVSPSSPEGGLIRRVMADLPNAKTVDDIRVLRSTLSLPPTASSGEKRMASILRDKLSDLEESSIVRAAKMMKNPAAREKVMALIDQKEAANKAYAPFREKLNTLLEKLGKNRVYGPKDALSFIEDHLTPEQVVDRLFSKKDSEFLKFFGENFPEQMYLMRRYQKGVLLDEASTGGAFSPLKLFNKVNKLEPEIRKAIFSGEELRKLKDAETYLRAMPKNFNPSGTSGMSAFRSFFEHPTGAVIGNIRDYGIEKFIQGVGSSPEVGAARALAMSTVRGDRLLTKTAGALFDSARLVLPASLLPDEKKTDRLKKHVDDTQTNPENLIDMGKKNPVPEYNRAFGTVAARAVNYLQSVKPVTSPASPLDPPRVPTAIEKAKYQNALEIAQQPLTVLSKLKDNTLTPADLQALTAIYPKAYQAMKQRVTQEMISHISKGEVVPYNLRQGLSLFMGEPLDSTMTPASIQAIQGVFARKAPQPQAQPMGGGKKGTAKLGKLSEGLRTPDQARASRAAHG